MTNRKRALLIVLLLFLAILIAYVFILNSNNELKDNSDFDGQTAGDSTRQNQQEKIKAPNFTVLDESGNEVEFYDFLGKPIVLNFWASWCGPCYIEMPDFDEAYKKYGEEINFLMINMTDGQTETIETASDFISNEGFSFPILFDTTQEAAYLYGAYSIPLTYFIDAEGYLVAQARGSLDSEGLQTRLNMILE